MAISASLKVDDRKVSVRCTEAIPDPTDRMNERIGLVAIDLTPDTSYVDIDDVSSGVKMKVPNVL